MLDAAAKVDEDDLFTYIYTSGTTGPPKGCMIRHRNYYEMVAVVDQLERLTVADDLLLLYLPLAHNFGRLMHLAGPYVGYTIAFLPDPLRTADALLQVRPTVLPSVPRVYEKVHAGVLAKFDEETGAKRRIVDWALGVGHRVSSRATARRADPHEPRAPSPARAQAGLLEGAGAARREIADRHLRRRAAGDATSPSSSTRSESRSSRATASPSARRRRPSTASRGTGPARSARLYLEPSCGWARTASCSSAARRSSPATYKDEAATREVLDDDGWLSSGDVAEIDADGFVTITDRKKDILVTAGGKNVAPANIENDLKAHREISQALVLGDRRPFVAALVTLDPDATAGMTDEQKQQRVQEIVDEVNQDRSRYEQIKRFVILPRDFSMDEDEVTPTLKLKRSVVHGALRARRSTRSTPERLVGGLQDAAGADEARRVRAAQRRDLHDVAGVRRVDEVPAADVDPDVAEPVEEDEVAGLELAHTTPARRRRTARSSSAAATRPPARRRTSRGPSSRSRTGDAPPQTYGVPRYCIAIPTTPQ